ncbi:hypothetical protein QYE76_010545 [Lolium multiflorum]|uniref:Uncharacterized protein n=1 Tax=Lolium multiflorum TaxID=4521 RepID=A0AAD8X4R0_LOLMU|nr:hypothetical protein QYE76_010541 [Lolium multiflorum]KAK1693848.1 hypothetical protein QYE76_010545 [Lolium multiflorum]
MFFTSPWMLLSLFLHLPEIDAGLVGEYRDATEPIRLPGCVPIHAHELPGSLLGPPPPRPAPTSHGGGLREFGARYTDSHAGFLSVAKDTSRVDGILVNTFGALEPAVGDGMDGVAELPVHAVGPLVWTRPVGVDRDHSRVIRWLDQQPLGSVVYLSFGSGGTLTLRQTTELALALEMTQCRFVWVVKRPNEESEPVTFRPS